MLIRQVICFLSVKIFAHSFFLSSLLTFFKKIGVVAVQKRLGLSFHRLMKEGFPPSYSIRAYKIRLESRVWDRNASSFRQGIVALPWQQDEASRRSSFPLSYCVWLMVWGGGEGEGDSLSLLPCPVLPSPAKVSSYKTLRV